jgi:cytochrome c biogenesis protein CcdA
MAMLGLTTASSEEDSSLLFFLAKALSHISNCAATICRPYFFSSCLYKLYASSYFFSLRNSFAFFIVIVLLHNALY